MPAARFVDSVRRANQVHGLMRRGARVLVAVSGGPDSVALLRALLRLQPALRLRLHVAHLNHRLRPEAADDAAFVRALALSWNLPVTVREEEVEHRCRREGWSLEDGARRVRYEFFAAVAAQQSAEAVAVAHTADDQAETVLMRLMRGASLLGLGAIPPKRPLEGAAGAPAPAAARRRRQPDVWVVRPLLGVWRDEVLAYLREEGLAYREDASNRDSRFLRNRVRHELLPLLQREYNPNIKGTLAQLAEQSRADYAYLSEAAARQWRRVSAADRSPAAVALSIPRLRRQPKALQRQLVRQAIERVKRGVGQLEFRHWQEVERLVAERPVGTVLDLPGGVQVTREATQVTLRSAAL